MYITTAPEVRDGDRIGTETMMRPRKVNTARINWNAAGTRHETVTFTFYRGEDLTVPATTYVSIH